MVIKRNEIKHFACSVHIRTFIDSNLYHVCSWSLATSNAVSVDVFTAIEELWMSPEVMKIRH